MFYFSHAYAKQCQKVCAVLPALFFSLTVSLSADQAPRVNIGGEIGLEGVIVDDGWQTLDSNRGYAFTGDWKPERIPEMENFVDGIHALNQKFMLWYSVPMAGEKSEVAKRFKDKPLGFSNSLLVLGTQTRAPPKRRHSIFTRFHYSDIPTFQ